MLTHPSDWQKYYHGTPEQQHLLRVYSYSDRLRYYWKFPEVESAVQRLVRNLEQRPAPETLLSQHCPRQYELVRSGKLQNHPKELVIANIMTVLNVYSKACRGAIRPSHRFGTHATKGKRYDIASSDSAGPTSTSCRSDF